MSEDNRPDRQQLVDEIGKMLRGEIGEEEEQQLMEQLDKLAEPSPERIEEVLNAADAVPHFLRSQIVEDHVKAMLLDRLLPLLATLHHPENDKCVEDHQEWPCYTFRAYQSATQETEADFNGAFDRVTEKYGEQVDAHLAKSRATREGGESDDGSTEG